MFSTRRFIINAKEKALWKKTLIFIFDHYMSWIAVLTFITLIAGRNFSGTLMWVFLYISAILLVVYIAMMLLRLGVVHDKINIFYRGIVSLKDDAEDGKNEQELRELEELAKDLEEFMGED